MGYCLTRCLVRWALGVGLASGTDSCNLIVVEHHSFVSVLNCAKRRLPYVRHHLGSGAKSTAYAHGGWIPVICSASVIDIFDFALRLYVNVFPPQMTAKNRLADAGGNPFLFCLLALLIQSFNLFGCYMCNLLGQ